MAERKYSKKRFASLPRPLLIALAFGVLAVGIATAADYAVGTYSSGVYGAGIYAGGDITAPLIEITAPTVGAIVHGASVTLTASSSDDVGVEGVQFAIDDTPVGTEVVSAPYTMSWDSTSVLDGSHAVSAVARDSQGNRATSTDIAITVDNTAPVRSAGSPSGALAEGTTNTTLALTTDENATCAYSTSPSTPYGSMTPFDTTGTTSHSSALSGLTDGGSYVYYVKCRDGQGNTDASDYAISFTVAADVTFPTVSMTAPLNNDTVSGSAVTLAADAADDVSVSSVQFKLDGSTNIGSPITSPPYTVTWDSTGVSGGTHAITAVATDGASNTTTSAVITVIVDNTAPMISAGSPSGTLAAGTTNSTLSVTTDENATCAYATSPSTPYGSMTAFSVTGSTHHTSPISGLVNGTSYDYYVKCRDGESNTDASDYHISFSVDTDTTAPTVSMTAPTDGATVSGSTIAVTADASDNVAVAGVQFVLDGSTNIGSQDIGVPYGVIWDTTGTTNGTHTVSAVAHDTSGNAATSSSVSVTVSNTSDGGGGNSGGDGSGHSSHGSSGSSVPTPGPAPAQSSATSSVPSISITRDLDIGAEGADVTALQTWLMGQGYTIPAGATGYFGTQTQTALAAWQAANGVVPAAGYFGALTRAKIAGGTTPNPGTLTPAPGGFTKDLTIGSEGLDVQMLQRYLNTHGSPVATTGAGSSGYETTYFGSATQAALAKFQAAHDINPAAGYFGPLSIQYVNTH